MYVLANIRDTAGAEKLKFWGKACSIVEHHLPHPNPCFALGSRLERLLGFSVNFSSRTFRSSELYLPHPHALPLPLHCVKPNVKAKHNRNRMKLIVNTQVIRRTVRHGWSILAIRRTMNCINSRLFSVLFTPPKPMVCSRIPLRMSTTWARVFFRGRLNRQNQYLPHPHTLPLPLHPAIFWLINFFTVPFGCSCCAAT